MGQGSKIWTAIGAFFVGAAAVIQAIPVVRQEIAELYPWVVALFMKVDPPPPKHVQAKSPCAICPEEIHLAGTSIAVGRDEVSAGEFGNFLSATNYDWTGCASSAPRTGQGASPANPESPVVCVNFTDATNYAEWLKGRSGLKYRLATSDEWKAFAGSAHRMEGRDKRLINCRDCDPQSSGLQSHGPLPASHMDANEYGVRNAYGNVMEWTSTCESGLGSSPGLCLQRIAIGGSWRETWSRLAEAETFNDSAASDRIGFRLVRDIEEVRK